jgi:hypothetical protein
MIVPMGLSYNLTRSIIQFLYFQSENRDTSVNNVSLTF